MLSLVNAFNLDYSEILSFGKELNQSDRPSYCSRKTILAQINMHKEERR